MGADPSNRTYGKLAIMRASSGTEENRSSSITPPIVCNQPDDVAEVTTLDAFRLRVRFFDGVEGHVDMNALVHSPTADVFAQLADPARFAEAYVEYGTVTWPNELDLAPDAMYQEIKQNGEWKLA
jgi:hypothetical protein